MISRTSSERNAACRWAGKTVADWPVNVPILTLVSSASRSRPRRIVRFRRRAILRRFVPHPRKMANVRRLVLAKASHTRPNRRGRLAPPTAGSASRVAVSTNASPVRPFQAPRTRLRLEAAFGGRYWRAARVVPVTAIGPASKFRPDRWRRLLRPPLAGHAPCFIGPPALIEERAGLPALDSATRPSVSLLTPQAQLRASSVTCASMRNF